MTQALTQVELIKFARSLHLPHISWRDLAYELSYWTEVGMEKESLLQEVMNFLLPSKYFIITDRGWSDWDLEIHWGIWSKVQLKVCSENHGGNKRLLRVRCALRISQLASMAMIGYSLYTIVAILLGMPEVAFITFILSMINIGVILYQSFHIGRILYQVLETIAKKVHLLPIQATYTKSVAQSAIFQS